MSHATQRRVLGVLWLTLMLNLSVLTIKVFVGLWTNSLSVLADALHSVTDSAGNIVGLLAMRFASPNPDREHPYGHQKYEAVATLTIAFLLGVSCLEIGKSVVDRLLKGDAKVDLSATAIALMLAVLGVNVFTAFYERNMGRRLKSSILIADAQHTMSDIGVTLTVLAGLMGVWLGEALSWRWLLWLDLWLSIPVAVLVLRSGWEVLQRSLPQLVDEMAIAPEEIHRLALSVEGVLNCHDVASRGVVGQQVFIEMHLIVAPHNVTEAHAITEAVEAVLHERYAPARIVIHVEPLEYQSDHLTYS